MRLQGGRNGLGSKHGKLCAGREFRGTMVGDVSGISAVKNGPTGPETWRTVVTLTGVDENVQALLRTWATINCHEEMRRCGPRNEFDPSKDIKIISCNG